MRKPNENDFLPTFFAMLLCSTLCVFLSGCQTKTAKLEPRYVTGMPLGKIPDSDYPVYIDSGDLVVDNNYQVWLDPDAQVTTKSERLLKVYRSNGKFYVISFTDHFVVSSKSRYEGISGKLPVEKIVIKSNPKEDSAVLFSEAFNTNDAQEVFASDIPTPAETAKVMNEEQRTIKERRRQRILSIITRCGPGDSE